MKNLSEILNEYLWMDFGFGFGNKTKTINYTDIPKRVPDKYIKLLKKLFNKVKSNIKKEPDVRKYLTHSMEEFWNELNNDYKYDHSRIDNLKDVVIDAWWDEIIEIVISILK